MATCSFPTIITLAQFINCLIEPLRLFRQLLLCSPAPAVSRAQIDLRRIDNPPNELEFKIEQSTDNVNFTGIATIGANNTNYTGLARNKIYYHRARAYNAAGISPYSNVATARTLKK